mgnify:CR=1 FL=1
MSWLEIALIGCALVGITAGAFLVAQRPSFWFGLGIVMLKAAWPYLAKRMKPEEEAAWRKAEKAGEGDAFLRKRRGQPPKG